MRLSQVLFSQGFGTRRECEGLALHGWVQIDGKIVDDPDAEVDPQGLVLRVRGQDWPVHAKALVLLHKPAGFECSRKPRHHPSVMSLLPPPLHRREVQPVGRLDEDTTGLLLLTDDGALIHRLTSPKKHVPKVYEVGTKHAVTPALIAELVAGVGSTMTRASCAPPRARRRREGIAPDAARGQVPPGQAHGGSRRQPRRDAAPQRLRPPRRCPPIWLPGSGAGWTGRTKCSADNPPMQVFRGVHHPGIASACALTIGNFDGVHRGHQAMLALLRSEAQHRGLPTCVLTFEPHPRDYLRRAGRQAREPRRRASRRCATS